MFTIYVLILPVDRADRPSVCRNFIVQIAFETLRVVPMNGTISAEIRILLIDVRRSWVYQAI